MQTGRRTPEERLTALAVYKAGPSSLVSHPTETVPSQSFLLLGKNPPPFVVLEAEYFFSTDTSEKTQRANFKFDGPLPIILSKWTIQKEKPC